MSHLYNALATAEQLSTQSDRTALPSDLLDSARFFTARLTQAASVLLRLPQDIAAQAIVTLYRYWLIDDPLSWEFSDTSAAALYLTAKVSAHPRSLRSITNVYSYLLSPNATLSDASGPAKDVPDSYYLSETRYVVFRNRLLNIEGQIANALGFDVHVALPYPLAITYLQTLDVFGPSQPKGTGRKVARRAVEYLNTALLSPQMLYLTQQPNALATAAIYLAAKDVGAKLPEVEWWEVFDTDREDLGFLALSMKSLEGWVKAELETWGDKVILMRRDLRAVMERQGNGVSGVEDEEAEMMRIMDEKTG